MAVEVDDPQPEVLDAGPLLDPATLGHALCEQLEAEVLAVERDRAIGVGDRQADVQHAENRHLRSARGLPPSVFVTVKPPSIGMIAPLM